MNRVRKLVVLAFIGLWCFILLLDTSYGVSPEKLRELTVEEVQNIERALPSGATIKTSTPRKMLVFWRCEDYFHTSIPVVNKALELMGKKTGAYDVVVTDDYSVFTAEKLKEFDAICLNNTTRLKFDPHETPERCKALMDFVRGGKGIVGVHAATDNFYKWPEAMEMMGGKFTGHPWTAGGTWAIKIDDPDHPLMKAFSSGGFKIKDEIYRTDPPLYSRSKQRVLMSLDVSDPATRNVRDFKPTDDDTGISWIKTWGSGRIFYCSLGHNDHIFWNREILRHYLDGIQFAFGDYKVDTQPKPIISSGKGVEMAELQKLLEQVKKYDWGQSRSALTEVSEIIKNAHSSSTELRKIESALLDVLTSDSTRAGKQFVCRELSIIGTGQSVSVLGNMLVDEETSDMARYALERIPGTAVDEALRGALRRAKGKPQIGIINSLGQRRDKRSVRVLSRLLDDSDNEVAMAAAAALGRIADSEATEVLKGAAEKASGKLQMVVLDSYLKCADQLVADGDKVKALTIYNELRKPDMPKPIRIAAAAGLINATK
ncbi:MAG: ThuA domain-containing protein [Sedimentisphaerales bacterium]|nr:ThuA domain-containing protein [Sedimentisphaerales bacterium]